MPVGWNHKFLWMVLLQSQTTKVTWRLSKKKCHKHFLLSSHCAKAELWNGHNQDLDWNEHKEIKVGLAVKSRSRDGKQTRSGSGRGTCLHKREWTLCPWSTHTRRNLIAVILGFKTHTWNLSYVAIIVLTSNFPIHYIFDDVTDTAMLQQSTNLGSCNKQSINPRDPHLSFTCLYRCKTLPICVCASIGQCVGYLHSIFWKWFKSCLSDKSGLQICLPSLFPGQWVQWLHLPPH